MGCRVLRLDWICFGVDAVDPSVPFFYRVEEVGILYVCGEVFLMREMQVPDQPSIRLRSSRPRTRKKEIEKRRKREEKREKKKRQKHRE